MDAGGPGTAIPAEPGGTTGVATRGASQVPPKATECIWPMAGEAAFLSSSSPPAGLSVSYPLFSNKRCPGGWAGEAAPGIIKSLADAQKDGSHSPGMGVLLFLSTSFLLQPHC